MRRIIRLAVVRFPSLVAASGPDLCLAIRASGKFKDLVKTRTAYFFHALSILIDINPDVKVVRISEPADAAAKVGFLVNNLFAETALVIAESFFMAAFQANPRISFACRPFVAPEFVVL
jgi:hypothetical protein